MATNVKGKPNKAAKNSKIKKATDVDELFADALTKPETPTQAHYVEWVQRQTGYKPKDAEEFALASRLVLRYYKVFQASDENKAAHVTSREERVAERENRRAELQEKKARAQKMKDELAAKRAERAANKPAKPAKPAKAAKAAKAPAKRPAGVKPKPKSRAGSNASF